jgi:hypothetical protein
MQAHSGSKPQRKGDLDCYPLLRLLTWSGETSRVFLCNDFSLDSFSEESRAFFASIRFATISTNQNSIAKGAETSKYPRTMGHMVDLSFGDNVQQSKRRKVFANYLPQR